MFFRSCQANWRNSSDNRQPYGSCRVVAWERFSFQSVGQLVGRGTRRGKGHVYRHP